LAALEAGEVEQAITMLENDIEPARAQAVAALTKAQDDATDRIQQTEATAGYVATILQFIVVLLVPAMALLFYRRRVNSQLREETIRMDARLETHRAVAEAKDNLIAAVSHELRTPLTSIAGFAEILHDDEMLSPAQHDMVEVINTEAKELARMVEDFLVAARFDHEVMELETAPVEVMGTIAPLVQAAEASGREIELDPRQLWVNGDRDRIAHIARNLLSNAVAHGGPMIRIVVLREDGAGRLVIADNGPGVAADAHDSLFEPFNNEGTRALVTGSLGMGLAVARELAREMDGELTLERTVDGWTCFTMSLPAAAAIEDGATAEAGAIVTEMVA
jgi:signal transduction histidine kinase